ncbi:MAG: phosphatidylinositol-specific phospholipase C1-like protein [Bythopirellula sp.]
MSQFRCFVILVIWISVGRVQAELPGTSGIDRVRLNQIQVIGSHNSYKAAIDPELFRIMQAAYPDAKALDYAHPPLSDQLNLGLRNLELDVFHDPEGGRYAKPLGMTALKAAGHTPREFNTDGKMNEPGFKVLHVQDIDFRSNCWTFVDALTELRSWSQKNPRHLPILVTMNVNDASIDFPGTVDPLPFDRAALDELDKVLISNLGVDELIRPDDVRGDYETLEAAVLAFNWPTLAVARGKFLFVLDDFGRKRDAYLAGRAGLKGSTFFVNTVPGNPEAAIMIRNHPRAERESIAALVRQGYVVRTRADAGTHEARRGDFTRFEAAKQSGAQVITTDYYQADWRINPGYRIRFDRGGCWRLNPISLPQANAGVFDADLE